MAERSDRITPEDISVQLEKLRQDILIDLGGVGEMIAEFGGRKVALHLLTGGNIQWVAGEADKLMKSFKALYEAVEAVNTSSHPADDVKQPRTRLITDAAEDQTNAGAPVEVFKHIEPKRGN